MKKLLIGLTAMVFLADPAEADVVTSSPTHFVLHHEATSKLTPEQLWARLIAPAKWWHPEHTYSGDAGNLKLEAVAGGLWREDWAGGSVAHGQVLFASPGKVLRLNAPFGPLQALGAYTIWTITVAPHDQGSLVTFDEVSTGPASADMAAMAKAVDHVKSQAIARLVSNEIKSP